MSASKAESFRHTLMKVSKHIDSEMLTHLKFVCLDVVPAAEMEKINNALDFFQALEKCCKISAENSDYLFSLLEKVGGTNLAKRLTPFCSYAANEKNQDFSSLSSCAGFELKVDEDSETIKFTWYRQLLGKISNSLTRENVDNLCLLSQEIKLAGTNIDGSVFINSLEQMKLISPINLEYLRERLCKIGRGDLQLLIDQYVIHCLNGQPTMPLDTRASISTHYQQQQQQSNMYNVYHSPVSAHFPLPYQLSPSGDNHVSHIRPDNLSVAERYYHSASVDNLRQGNATLVAGTRESLSERQYYSCTLAGDQLPFHNQLYSMQTARRHSMNASELYSPYNRQQCQYMPMDGDIKSRKQSGVCEQADPTQHISESRSGSSASFCQQSRLRSLPSGNTSDELHHSAFSVNESAWMSSATRYKDKSRSVLEDSVSSHKESLESVSHPHRRELDQHSSTSHCHPLPANHNSSMSALQIPSGNDANVQLSTPMQVEDDDISCSHCNNLIEKQLEKCTKCQKGILVTQGTTANRTVHQNNTQQLESKESEFQYRKEIEMKLQQQQKQHHQIKQQLNSDTQNTPQCAQIVAESETLELKEQVRQQQVMLQKVNNELSKLRVQYEQLHAGSPSEKKTLRQDDQNVIKQNEDQVEHLTEDTAQLHSQTEGTMKYQLIKNPHGMAVIINNFEFQQAQTCCSAKVDEGNLRAIWESVHYNVLILRNRTASQLIYELKQIALKNHDAFDSFVCCILSYGHLDGVYGTDGELVKIADIMSIFKHDMCPTLANKPKLFFVLTIHKQFVNVSDNKIVAQALQEKDVQDPLHQFLFKEVDFFFAYNTANISWRSRLHCTSKLRDVFKNYATQCDLLNMLTAVNNNESDQAGYKQYSILFVSLLRKQLWFCEPMAS